MPISWQRTTFWVLALIAMGMVIYVPIFLITYGVDAVFTQSFAEGIVIETFGAIGTAVVVVNIEIFAVNAGLVPDSDLEESTQIKVLQTEIAGLRQTIADLKLLIESEKESNSSEVAPDSE